MAQVQILGIRDGVGANAFIEKKWRAPSVSELIANIDKYVDDVPEEERYNLYYTAALVQEGKGRKHVVQDIIPFDIDDIDVHQIDKVVDAVIHTLNVPREKVGIIFTGHGLQFLVMTESPWDTAGYFNLKRPYYKLVCTEINAELRVRELEGHADTSVWSPARLLRLPNTENRKPDKPNAKAYIIQSNIEPVPWEWEKSAGIEWPELNQDDLIHPDAFLRMPKPDSTAVQQECEFLKYCKENQESVSEPQWYGMLSIIGRLENGHELAHEYSKGHPEYDPDEVDRKYQQATTVTGPRTCANIDTQLWDGCINCKHYKSTRIVSPVTIRGENHIATKDTGFWIMGEDSKGNVKRKAVAYGDLYKHYNNLHPHVIDLDTSGIFYKYVNNYWQEEESLAIKAFALNNVVPQPSMNQRGEFLDYMRCTNQVRGEEFFNRTGYISTLNGVVCVKTGELKGHDKDYGMKYVLPFKYDPSARAHKWEEFLRQVTCNRQELIDVLQEFIGYTLSYDDPRLGQKALILVGSGSNGKSVLLEIVRSILGKDNVSAVNLRDAFRSDEKRYSMLDKMANVTEESPTELFQSSDTFKNMATGGDMSAKKLYHGTFNTKYRGKMLLACNEIPHVHDRSEGTVRRLIIVPFNLRISKEERNPHIISELQEELSGIFNWALEGYRRLLENGYEFTDSNYVQEEIQRSRIEGSRISDFIEDRLTVTDDVNDYVTTQELYDQWKFEAPSNYSNSVPKSAFAQELASVMRVLTGNLDYQTSRRYVGGKRIRVFTNLKMEADNDSAY